MNVAIEAVHRTMLIRLIVCLSVNRYSTVLYVNGKFRSPVDGPVLVVIRLTISLCTAFEVYERTSRRVVP